MASKTKLPVSLSEFFLHARKLSSLVSKHRVRIEAASGGRINDKVGKKLLRIVEELEELGSDRKQLTVRSAKPILREAAKLITTIDLAAQYAGKTDPVLADQI